MFDLFEMLSASIDPDEFSWLVYTRSTKMRLPNLNQRHTLVLEKGDIFGVKFTRAKTYQIVKSNALHVIYRNVPKNTHDRILKNTIPFDGDTPSDDEVEEGFTRHRRVSTREKAVSNKRTDDYYRPNIRVSEKYQIDQANYQWRKVKKGPIRVISKKQGKAKATLRQNDVVGMRFSTPARGGYLLLQGNVRVHIAHELYTQIVQSSRVLPTAEQKDAKIDIETKVDETKKTKPKYVRNNTDTKRREEPEPELDEPEPIRRMYDIDSVDDDFMRKTKRRASDDRSLRRSVRKMLDVPEQETWNEDEDEAFDEEGDIQNQSLEQEPEQTDFDPEPEAEDDPEFEDEDTDENTDSETEDETEDTDSEPEPEPEPEPESQEDVRNAVDVLEPGLIFKMKKGKGRRFVVVSSSPMERNENLQEIIVYALDDDDLEDMYRLRLNTRMPMSKFLGSAEVEGEGYDPEELSALQKALDYAEIQPLSFVK